MGLRELAVKATGALAGAGAVRSLRTGLLPLNASHAQNLLVDAKLACVAEHTALCYKHKSKDSVSKTEGGEVRRCRSLLRLHCAGATLFHHHEHLRSSSSSSSTAAAASRAQVPPDEEGLTTPDGQPLPEQVARVNVKCLAHILWKKEEDGDEEHNHLGEARRLVEGALCLVRGSA